MRYISSLSDYRAKREIFTIFLMSKKKLNKK